MINLIASIVLSQGSLSKMTIGLAIVAVSVLHGTNVNDQALAAPWVEWILASPASQTYDGGVWPSAGVVDRAAVPEHVWAEQRQWAQRMIRSPWVPSDLQQQTTPARFRGDDVLCYRMFTAGWRVQVTDDAGGVTLVCTPEGGLSGSSEDSVRNALRTVTKFPEDELSALTLRIRERTVAEHPGFTFVGSALESTPIGEHAWWQQFAGLTDGRSILIRMSKLDGTQRSIAATTAPEGRLRFNIQ